MENNFSKIPRVNIEIPDYTFFHSPSQREKNDGRFIGRDRIIHRLKNILTNNESKTGSYLITGYRGMGKSSFVNKVLNQITLKNIQWPIHVVTCLFMWFLIAILLKVFQEYMTGILFGVSSMALIWEIISYPAKKGEINCPMCLKIYKSNFVTYLLTNILSCSVIVLLFFCSFSSFLYSKTYIEHLMLLVSFITLSGIIIFYTKKKYGLILYYYSLYAYYNKNSKNKKASFSEYVLSKVYYFCRCFRDYFGEINKRRKRIVIHLNLGHEALDEKDIACLIAKNLETEFRKYAFSFRRQWRYYLIKSFLITILAGTLSQTTTDSSGNNDNVKYEVGLASGVLVLFPSQYSKNLSHTTFTKGKTYLFNTADSLSRKNELGQSTLHSNLSKDGRDLKIILFNNATDDIINHFCWLVNLCDIYVDQGFAFVTSIISPDRIYHLNYLFILYFLTFILLSRLISNAYFSSKYASSTSRRSVLKRLKFLNDNIDATIKTDKLHEASGTFQKIRLGSKISSSREFPIAGIRQIEKNLILILDDIDNLAPWILKPEFIFVFDELDKIDPEANQEDKKKNTLSGYDASVAGFAGGTNNRFQKQNVLKLLGNLKYLITTAKAKFIFISGRELYDAFLADVSDRQFAISSIFHEVLYVDSFLSDSSDGRKGDITSMTEHYVCQILIPKWYLSYLIFSQKEEIKKGQKNSTKKSFSESQYELLTLDHYVEYLLNTQIVTDFNELERVNILLYQFINYLTHVSNGAPKKISNLVERHIVFIKKDKRKKGKQNSGSCIPTPNNIYIGEQEQGMFLSFSYLDQCKIGFIHYLAHPVILGVMNNISAYGDKLLVSASFLTDHIFKFHNNGFSWRNLENTPEILDSSRSPELRTLIDSIISYLSQTHINSIVSGLYLFKFPKKISEEIQFISKMSEEASALFNFTLDESLSVKKFYREMLDSHIESYSKEKGLFTSKSGDLLHTIANIHHILGDLHLFDEEYTDAAFEYQNCLQFITLEFNSNYDSHNDSHLLFIVRNMLKLGLAFEKRKTYNSAYVTYSELISLLIDFRYLDENKLGLEFKIQPLKSWRKYRSILFKQKNISDSNPSDFNKATLPEFFENDELEELSMVLRGEEVNPGLAYITTPLKNKIISRLSMFEDMRLMYQALLAKLFVLEKHQLGGISRENLDVTEGEFIYLHLATNLKDKFLISADFFKKIGDILYYKNGLITHQSSNLFEGLYFWDYYIQFDIEKYVSNLDEKDSLNAILKIPFRDFSAYINVQEKSGKDIKKLFFREHFIIFINQEYIEESAPIDKRAAVKRAIESVINSDHNRAELAQEDSKIERVVATIRSFFDEGNRQFDPPAYNLKLISKALDCCSRREYLLHKRNNAPCFACKYYNRSLKILADNLLNLSENEYPSTKAILFLEALDNNSYKFYSSRANFNQNLAAILGGFGDVMVGCATDQDYIFPRFLDVFLRYIDGEIKIEKLNEIKDGTDIQDLYVFDLNVFWEDNYLVKQMLIKEPELFSGYKKVSPVSSKLSLSDEHKKTMSEFDIEAYEKVEIDNLLLLERDQVIEFLKRNRRAIILQSYLAELSKKGFSQLEKALLYYLASAKYYKRSSNYRESAFMYKKILKLLIQYVESKPIYKDWIGRHITAINQQITRRIIQNIHSSYEHIHITESNKWFKERETLHTKYKGQTGESVFTQLYDHLTLAQLSVFPELEDVVYTQYRLEITCGYLNANSHHFNNLYNMSSISSRRVNSSIYNRLISLRFKAFLNQNRLESLLPSFKLDSVLGKCHCNAFYRALEKWERLDKDFEPIENLVLDSIFCLQKFIEVIYPHNITTLFNCSYIANIYNSLYKWTVLHELLEHWYRNAIDGSLGCKQKAIPSSYICSVCKCEQAKPRQSQLDPSKASIRLEYIQEQLGELVDKSQINLINSSYFAEMAIKKYQSAFAMHREGKAYKDTIESMYLLNDDLDNESFKFYIALERYRINTSDIYNNMRKLKEIYSDVGLFDIKNYR